MPTSTPISPSVAAWQDQSDHWLYQRDEACVFVRQRPWSSMPRPRFLPLPALLEPWDVRVFVCRYRDIGKSWVRGLETRGRNHIFSIFQHCLNQGICVYACVHVCVTFGCVSSLFWAWLGTRRYAFAVFAQPWNLILSRHFLHAYYIHAYIHVRV
jgi:hypothetical protein